MQVLALYNSHAGTVKDCEDLIIAMKQMPELTVCTMDEVFADPKEQDQRRVAWDNFDYILIMGGDGTIHHCVNKLYAEQVTAPLLFLPMGTGNDFCRTVIGSIDPVEVWQHYQDIIRGALAPKLIWVDAIKIDFINNQSRLVINVCSGGFSGQMQEIVNDNDSLKQRWGAMAYLRAAAEALVDLKEYRLRYNSNDSLVGRAGCDEDKIEDWLEVDCLNFIVANGRYAAKGFEIAPRAQLSDGLMDIIIIKATALSELMSTAVKLIQGDYLEEEHVQFFQCRSLTLKAPLGMSFSLDGELHEVPPRHFEILKQAFRVVAYMT